MISEELREQLLIEATERAVEQERDESAHRRVSEWKAEQRALQATKVDFRRGALAGGGLDPYGDPEAEAAKAALERFHEYKRLVRGEHEGQALYLTRTTG